MNRKLILLVLFITTFLSCKKDHQCHCDAPNGSREEMTVHDTRNNAQKECFDWAEEIKSQHPDWTCDYE